MIMNFGEAPRATGWALDDDQLRRLTEAGDQPLPYPYELQRLPQFVRRQG